jgi:hypothetical protein
MDVKHLILEVTAFAELQRLLDLHAKNGFKTISYCSYFDIGQGKTYYTALMVKDTGSEKP